MNVCRITLFCVAACLGMASVRALDDVPFADFEGATYGAWKTEGAAFGGGPAQGALPGQMPVEGFQGRGLASSFHGGDDAQGRLISPDFTIKQAFITFLIGGGGHEGKTCLNLVVAGRILRTATGPNVRPGGSERLAPGGWDVGELRGRRAHIEIIDAAGGGWGHLNVDQIMFTDTKPNLAPQARADVSRDILATEHWLSFPVTQGAEKRTVTVRVDGKEVRRFEAELADGPPDWWAPLDVREWRGRTLSVTVDRLPEGSRALEQMTQSDAFPDAQTLYHEPGRPQFHFSARRGWLNDPNGLVFFGGQYHLFFQHGPFSWGDSAKWWGHAVSRDLVRWTELEEALAPDALGAMWSGSAVVDHDNTSGLGAHGKPPLVLIYTAAGDPFTQCIASSTDGRTFTKYAGNPIVKNITGGNRDPKVFWHTPTKRWVLALWVGQNKRNTIHFFTSPNLREWTPASVTEGGPDGDGFLYECPDMFELPLDGDQNKKKWVLAAANGEYAVGAFDGTTFTAEATKLPGPRGSGFYAPQTFNDAPHGRRIQIGWFQTATPGMPFNQSMSLSLELHLVTTPAGPRLTWEPVKELASLRAKSHKHGPFTLSEGAANPLSAEHGELLELRAEFEPPASGQVTLSVRGVPIVYDAETQEIVVNGHRAPAPLRDGKQRLTIYVDRTGLEVFAAGGLTFVPVPINLKPDDTNLAVSVKGGPAKFRHLDVYQLRSAWAGVE